MCAAPNLSNLTSWNLSKPPTENTASSFSTFSYTSKPKLLNYRMLIVNESSKHDDHNNMPSKYFLSSVGAFHLPPSACNVVKRSDGLQSATNDNSQHNLDDDCRTVISVASRITNDNSQNNNLSHAKLRPYSCEDCGKTFIQKHHLTTHKKVHSGVRPHSCPHCGKAFTHKHCLNTHLLLHSSDRPYQCNVCKKSFTLKHHLISHAKVHSREKPFICTDCGCAFPLKRHLVTHTKFHAGERPFVCEECGESFAHKDHLVMHSRFHGSTDSFVCHDCGATFTRKFELVNHSRLHGHIPLSCPVCNKEFLQKRTLVVHMRLHTSETPFHCVTCGDSFHVRSELTHHLATHESQPSNNRGRLLTCGECGSSFNNTEALALHVKLHSADASLVNDLCVLTANVPSANFPFSNGLKTSAQSSSNTKCQNSDKPAASVKVKSHICKFCSKAFSAKHGLQQHNKRHPEGTCALKSHICDTCNKAFYQKNHLLLHQRQHMDLNVRSSNHSKPQRDVESSSSDANENFYSPSQESSVNFLNITTKVLNSDETSSIVDLTDKGNQHVLHYESYSLPKFKVMDIQTEENDKQCKIKSSVEAVKDENIKNNFVLNRANCELANLSNVDVKMQISSAIMDIGHVKGDNHRFSVVEQTVT